MNGIFVIDKPPDFTSHDVAAKLRGVLKERRIGHGGTLDPMATGVLPIFAGRATRAVEFITGSKIYTGEILFGVGTDSYDITGNVIKTSNDLPDFSDVLSAARDFSGEVDQVPPMVSAVKIGGRKLYELARKGAEIERPARRVTFYDIELEAVDIKTIKFKTECSPGTYIRAFAHDLGEKLGCPAVLTALRRVKSGPFTIEQAVKIEEAANVTPLPVDALFGEYPRLDASGGEEFKVRNGTGFRRAVADGRYRLYGVDGEFLAVCEVREGVVGVVKSFFMV